MEKRFRPGRNKGDEGALDVQAAFCRQSSIKRHTMKPQLVSISAAALIAGAGAAFAQSSTSGSPGTQCWDQATNQVSSKAAGSSSTGSVSSASAGSLSPDAGGGTPISSPSSTGSSGSAATASPGAASTTSGTRPAGAAGLPNC